MSPNGTAAYDAVPDLPSLVERAVSLAWLASGAQPGARLVSVERDAGRAEQAAQLFSAMPWVTVIRGDWAEIYLHGPFDLLVLDAERTVNPAPRRLTRTCCCGRAAPWSLTISPGPPLAASVRGRSR